MKIDMTATVYNPNGQNSAVKISRTDQEFAQGPGYIYIEIWNGYEHDKQEEKKDLQRIVIRDNEARIILQMLQKAFF